MASQIARTFAVSIRPSSHRSSVAGSVAVSWSAWWSRAIAVPRDSRSATPTSSGANRLIVDGRSQLIACGSSPGRRRPNSASNRACRADAHADSRSNATISSIRSASPSPAPPPPVAASTSNANHPDGTASAGE